ncbi:MAG: hypothetical protein LJE68_00495, partial [Rhodobacter sp.]|nr:hypothetical protein [Rhodobacter sp.]
PAPAPPEDYGLPRALLENVVLRFGHDNPDAPEAELVAFLKETAKEWQALKARLAGLEAMDGRLANLRGAAESAIAAGEFAEADARLADAEEMQQAERTLAEVRKQAEVREARGMAALMGGDEAAAAAHFETAAGFFAPFDTDEGGRRLNGLTEALYRRGVAFGGEGLTQAIRLWESNLSRWTRDAAPQNWAMTQNNLAVALRNQAARTEGAAGAALLGRAVAAYEAALEVYTREAAPQDWAMTQNNLANALSDQAERTEAAAGAALLCRAVAAYEAALEVRTREAAPQGWAMTQNNLAFALLSQAARVEPEKAVPLLKKARRACDLAHEVRTRDAAPLDHATAQWTLGLVLEAIAEHGDRREALAAAKAAFETALGIFDAESNAPQYATCMEHLERIEGKLAGG